MTQFGELEDSGEREQFDSGAQRDTRSGKGRYDLISPFLMKRVAVIMEKGAIKYDARNWEKGMPISRFLDSALRHIFQHLEGDRIEDHLAQAVFNLMGAMHTEEAIALRILDPKFDDRPDYQSRTPLTFYDPKIHKVVGGELVKIT